MNVQEEEADLDVEIDPQLYLKCRLCIVENGSYRIHPSVQQQILYCFDITVKHTDHLSQLICRKCKSILNEYSETKRTFLKNQDVLLHRLNEPKIQETVEKDEEPLNENVHAEKDTKDDTLDEQLKVTDNTDPVLSDSSSKPQSDETEVSSEQNESWKLCFDRRYVCRFCSLHLSTRKQIRRHYKIHSKLLGISKKKIKKHCRIILDRCDKRQNFTGQSGTVVFSPDRIIIDEGNINYYIAYQPKNEHNAKKKHTIVSKRVYDSGSSDDDDFLPKPSKKKKKFRLMSRSSSNETVVIDGQKSTADAVEDEADIINYGNDTVAESQEGLSVESCINIDDSSNDASDITESTQKDQTKHNLKEIQTITTMCYTKYINNCSNDAQVEKIKKDVHLDESLNRKLLSIGRKIMSTQGISSPGLLKYLQHKNLAINWVPNVKSPTSLNKHANYVRVMTKIEAPVDVLNGWAAVTVNEDLSEPGDESDSIRQGDVSKVVNQPQVNENVYAENDSIYNVTLNPITAQETDSTTKNKLLNANPVANPKTLPKKTVCQDSKPDLIKLISKVHNTSDSICIESDDDSAPNNVDLSMPIITSTTSLAEHPPKSTDMDVTSNINDTKENLSNGTDKPFPRIKCKPVSELMAPNKVQDNNKPVMIILPATSAVQVNSAGPQPQIAIVPKPSTAPPVAPLSPIVTLQANNIENDGEYITMNSIDLPNKSTSNPIEYFRVLLEMHGLILLTVKDLQLEKAFVCLVKFKLDISRQDRSVIVGLSLFARNNIFCIKLTKMNGQEMDINILPTFWQMHILKSFEGDVSEKILSVASKISHTLYLYAKKFVSLLRSIEYKSANSTAPLESS